MPDPKALTAEQPDWIPGSADDLNLNSYYYGFDPTGNLAVDRILHMVARAGKAYHNTESWSDDDPEWGASPSHSERIQAAANLAAKAIDAAVAAERERVLGEVGAIAAEGVVSMNTTQQSIDKAIRRRDWGEVCGYIADLYGGRLALNAILAAANPSNPIKEGGEG